MTIQSGYTKAYAMNWDATFKSTVTLRLREKDPISLTRYEFDALPEYSLTIPTCTKIGKRWKRRSLTGWSMGEYVPDSEPGMITILWRRIEIDNE